MVRPSFDMSLSSKLITKPLGAGSSETTTTGPGIRTLETVSGTNRRKPVGWVPPTNYFFHKEVIEGAMGRLDWSQKFPTFEAGAIYTGCVGFANNSGPLNINNIFSATMQLPPVPSSLRNEAMTKAQLALKDQKVNLAVAWAERSRTASLIGDTFARMARSVRNLRQGRWQQAMRDLGILHGKREPRGSNWPQKWLELQYGWKPLLSDVYGACDALSKRPSSDWIVTGKGTALEDQRGLKILNDSTSPVGWICEGEGQRGAFTRIDAVPSNDFIRSLASVGVTNPLEVVWELVPYSFVVDWAIPIGKWLSSMDAGVGFNQFWISTTVWVRGDWHARGLGRKTWTTGGVSQTAVNDFTTSYKYLDILRSASQQGSLPIGRPWVKDPRSLGHMANGLALLSQAFGR